MTGHLAFLIELFAIMSAAVAVVTSAISTFLGRRSVSKMKRLARRNANLQKALIDSFRDRHIDDGEMRSLLDVYVKLLKSDKPSYRVSKLVDRRAKSILQHAVSSHNENLFIELASEAISEEKSSNNTQ